MKVKTWIGSPSRGDLMVEMAIRAEKEKRLRSSEVCWSAIITCVASFQWVCYHLAALWPCFCRCLKHCYKFPLIFVRCPKKQSLQNWSLVGSRLNPSQVVFSTTSGLVNWPSMVWCSTSRAGRNRSLRPTFRRSCWTSTSTSWVHEYLIRTEIVSRIYIFV